MAFKLFRIGARVTSSCGQGGRVIDRTVIGGDEYYIVKIGPDRRDQIARLHSELSAA